MISDVKIGLGASLFHPLVGPEFLVEANSAIWNGFFLALYTIYSLDTLGMSPGTLGLVISAGGVGALFGAMLAGRMSRRLGLGPAMILCMAGTRAAVFFIPLAQGPLWFAVTCLLIHQLLGDALLMSYYVLAVSLRQSVLPQETLGRSNAAFQVATGVFLPLGALVAGQIAQTANVRTALWLSALGGLINPLVLYFSPVRRLKKVPMVDLAQAGDHGR
jgi:predicted MFS family arabinose efflux permease